MARTEAGQSEKGTVGGEGAWDGHRGAGSQAGPWKRGRLSTGRKRRISRPKGLSSRGHPSVLSTDSLTPLGKG